MAETARVAGFLPSTSGFHFSNDWPSEPDLTIPIPIVVPTGHWSIAIGDASNGLCGGMAFAVRDIFEAELEMPEDVHNPLPDTPLFRYIFARLIDSFDLPTNGPSEWFTWSLPTRNQFKDTVETQLERIRREVRAGRLAAIGLVRIRTFWPGDWGVNHQVLVWGFDDDDAHNTVLHLYDPNHPDHDDITLRLNTADPNGPPQIDFVVDGSPVHGTHEVTFGCFVLRYTRVDPGPMLAVASASVLSAHTARVVYHAAGDDIEELSLTSGGVWTRGDLTELTGGLAAAGDPLGYLNWVEGVPRVVYRGSDDHIREFSLQQSWASGDLSALTGAPPAAGNPVAYATWADDTNRVVYRGSDGHLHEISLQLGAVWSHADLSSIAISIAGSPVATGDPCGYLTSFDHAARVTYRGADEHIHELSVQPGDSWVDQDMSVGASAPAAAGDPSAYVSWFDGVARIVFRGHDGHIYEISHTPDGLLSYGDLTALSSSPEAAGDPFGYLTWFDRTARVIYRGYDSHIHETSLPAGGEWSSGDLTALARGAPAAGDPMAYFSWFDRTARVVYRGGDGHIHEISLPHGGVWSHGDLTALTGAPAAVGDPRGYLGPPLARRH